MGRYGHYGYCYSRMEQNGVLVKIVDFSEINTNYTKSAHAKILLAGVCSVKSLFDELIRLFLGKNNENTVITLFCANISILRVWWSKSKFTKSYLVTN